MTLADLATSIDHDHLGAVIRSVAYRAGSLPEQTPAFAAVELYTAAHVRALASATARHRLQHSMWADLPSWSRPSRRASRFAKYVSTLIAPSRSIHLRNGHVAAIGTSDGDRPGRRGRRDLRSVADLRRPASAQRSAADQTAAAQTKPGGSPDHHPP